MPTQPTAPDTNAAVDRLTLGVDSPRGTEPATTCPPSGCWCSDAEASALYQTGPGQCFEATTSSAPCSYSICACSDMGD